MSWFKQLRGSLSYYYELGRPLRRTVLPGTTGIAALMLEIVFWTLVALVGYVYFGYPALLLLLSRGVRKAPEYPEAKPPRVTLLISAFNEADCIAAGETWMSRQVVGYPVFADCLPVDHD